MPCWTTFADLWIGASDTASEATFVWDSTGEKLSPGYTGWVPGHPYSAGCSGNTSDCVIYHYTHDLLPAWEDYPCSSLYGGICELQPSNSSQSNWNIKTRLVSKSHQFYISYVWHVKKKLLLLWSVNFYSKEMEIRRNMKE